MPYTKKTYVNDSSPYLNAANLNSSEQGIKDGVDHADSTHAPSDAEANSVEVDENNVFTAAQRGQIAVLSYSANITPDLATSNRYKCVLTGGTQIENPTNIADSQGGLIYLEQDATGGRAVTWGTYWNFLETPSEDTTGSKVNVYAYEVYSTTKIVASYVGAF